MKILIKTPVVLFLLFDTVVEFGQNLGNEISVYQVFTDQQRFPYTAFDTFDEQLDGT